MTIRYQAVDVREVDLVDVPKAGSIVEDWRAGRRTMAILRARSAYSFGTETVAHDVARTLVDELGPDAGIEWYHAWIESLEEREGTAAGPAAGHPDPAG